MANTYDFYKPQLDSEYPEVDGPLTVTTYLGALDASYDRYREKFSKSLALLTQNTKGMTANLNGANGHSTFSDRLATADKSRTSFDDFQYLVFHNPYCKLVQKAHAGLVRFFIVAALPHLTFPSSTKTLYHPRKRAYLSTPQLPFET